MTAESTVAIVTPSTPRPRIAAFPIAVAIASRLFSIALLLVIPSINPATVPRLTSLLSPFVSWDGQWYLRIARNGYHVAPVSVSVIAARHDFAFYPGWPGLVWVIDRLGIPAPATAVLGANVLFVAALAVIYAVLVDRFGTDAARRGVLLLAFAPSAYVLSMAYSEPLFLLVVGLAFLRPARAGGMLAAAASVLVRVAGLAVLAAKLAVWLQDRRERRALLTAIAVGLAFAAWWAYIWWLTGDPAGWTRGSLDWGRVGGIRGILDVVEKPTLFPLAALAFVLLMLIGAGWVIRRDLELGVYSIVAIGLGVLGGWVTSMPRYALVAFPVFALLGLRLGRRGTIVLAIVFAIGQAAFVYSAFDGPAATAP